MVNRGSVPNVDLPITNGTKPVPIGDAKTRNLVKYHCTHCGFANSFYGKLEPSYSVYCFGCRKVYSVGDSMQNRYEVEQHGEQGRMRSGSPIFYGMLQSMAELHDRKSHDYASNDNPFENYHFAGKMSKLFDNPDDAGFIGRIGEKLYRLANLENNNKSARNESVEDTENDLCVIMVLWVADRRARRMRQNAKSANIGEQYNAMKSPLESLSEILNPHQAKVRVLTLYTSDSSIHCISIIRINSNPIVRVHRFKYTVFAWTTNTIN
jgi:hypothetical protein